MHLSSLERGPREEQVRSAPLSSAGPGQLGLSLLSQPAVGVGEAGWCHGAGDTRPDGQGLGLVTRSWGQGIGEWGACVFK